MPYEIQLPDGTIVGDIPDDLDPSAAKAQILRAYPELALGEKRTIGEAAKDVAASLGVGVGSLFQVPGQVAGLVTGKVDETTGLQGVGKRLETFAEQAKSPVLRAKEAARSQKIAQAEGFFDEMGTAIGQTIKDPALIGSFIFEQVPNLVGTMGGGLLTRGAIKVLMTNATEEAMKPVLAKAGVRGAVGTGAIMQGADIGTNTFENVYNELISQGVDQDTAMKEALASGRAAAIQAGALTLGTSFGAGSTIERALTRGMAGVPKTGIIRGTLGETLSEAVEEGGGQLVSNIQLQQVAPETDIMKGVGAAAGLGAIGGALFGLPASFVNKANAAELERAKAQLEEARRKAAETLQPQNVNLAIGYDPNVEGSGVYTPIIVNPDGTTIFPSERNKFAPTATSELSEEGLREKYGIPSPEQIKDRTFDTDRIKSFGISPKANLYRNKDILGSDISNPEEAAKVKDALQAYLKKYPNVNAAIRKNIEDYLARPEFQPLPVSEGVITEATTTPEADQRAIRDRMIEGFKNRPEIKKIYEDYNKFLQARDVDKAALSAFNTVVSADVLKNLGINPVATIYQDPEVVNADLSVPENADRVRAKLMAFKEQSKSKQVKDNIDTYLNRVEFLTPQYVYDLLNPPVDVKKEEGQETFVYFEPDGTMQTKYGTITKIGNKRYAKYKDGKRELTEDVLVNPNPIQIEILELYRRKESLAKEPDEFKKWMMGYGIDPSERADIGIDKRVPNRLFRRGGFYLDDLLRIALEQQILSPADVDVNSVDGGVQDFRDLIRTSLDGGFVPTPNNVRVMADLENIQNQIEYLENQLKGAPEEAIAEEFKGEAEAPPPKAPKKPRTAQDVLAGMEAKALEFKNLPREGMSPEELEVMDLADQVEAAGQPGFATAMRSNVARKAINQKAIDFYRDQLQKFLAQKGQVRSPIDEGIDLSSFVEGYKKDEARLRDQTDFFGTKTSETVAKSNDYIKRLAKVINDAGYQVREIGLNEPKNLRDIKAKISQIAGSTTRLMKEQEALDKGYQRADAEKYQKTLATLEQDFIEADELLGEAPQASKSTMEQKKAADAVANAFVGGEVAWQEGDLALIRTFSNRTGDPIYIPAKGYDYINKMIDDFVNKIDIKDVKNTPITQDDIDVLLKAKNKIEKKRAKLEESKKDFIKFDKDGVALSKDIDPKLAGVISEWKKLFGLKNNIYISTTEDAIANRDNFVGPYSRIASATYDPNENGVTQLLPNGERYIIFKRSTSISKMLETIAHEMGHAHQQEVYNNASPEIKKSLRVE